MVFTTRTADPVHDAAVYDRYLEERRRRYLRGCPECVECGELIEDEMCYVFENDECMCRDCGKDQLDLARKLNTGLYEIIEDKLLEMWRYTPHDDEAEEDIA